MSATFERISTEEMKAEAENCHKIAIAMTEKALDKRAELMTKYGTGQAAMLRINLEIASTCNEVTYWERRRDLNLDFLRTSIKMEDYMEFIKVISRYGLSLGGMV